MRASLRSVKFTLSILTIYVLSSILQLQVYIPDCPGWVLRLRDLSINLGGGKCKWIPPNYIPTSSKNFYKTLITGYPGGSKRVIYTQIEALVGLSSNDEWPAEVVKPNLPFTKTNYPHHEGIWSWGKTMDQVILVLRNPRHALVEYHNVLHDIDYANNAADAYAKEDNLYLARAPVEQYLEWRNNRTEYEINWWGWFIDYWLEGGIMRDIMTHKLTTFEHFQRQKQPGAYTESGKAFDSMVGDAIVQPELDDHCVIDMPSGACQPVAIISIDKLMDPVKGYGESSKLAAALDGLQGIDVIADEARDCIWEEVIIRRKGVRTMRDRTGPKKEAYDFTAAMYGSMIQELSRLKSKYGAPEWDDNIPAQDLLELLDDYILDITKDLISS